MAEADEIRELRLELAALTAKITKLESGADQSRDLAPENGVSRRHLLRALGGAAAAGVGLAIGGEVLAPAPAGATTLFTTETTDPAVRAITFDVGPAAEIITGSRTVNGSFQGGDGPALIVKNNAGLNTAASFSIAEGANASPVITVQHEDVGSAVRAVLSDAANTTPVFDAQTAGSGACFRGTAMGTGAGVDVHGLASASSPTVNALQEGTGRVFTGEIRNASNAASAFDVRTNGTGRGMLLQTTNAASSARGLDVRNSGSGTALYGLNSGTGSALEAEVTRSTNTAPVVNVHTTGAGTALQVSSTNTGSTADLVNLTQAGHGRGLNVQATQTFNENTLIFAVTQGPGTVANFLANNVGDGTNPVTAVNIGSANRVGNALNAEISDTSGTGSAVFGHTFGTGIGVAGDSAKGIGVVASVGSTGRAPLRLVPRGFVGAPTTGVHEAGELSIDKQGSLFHCKNGNGTTVGTWLRVGFNPMDPIRFVDTRPSRGPVSNGDQPLAANTELLVPVVGVNGVPVGASAVALNLTVVSPTAGGFLSLYPAGLTFDAGHKPTFANLNFDAGKTVGNFAIVKLAPENTLNAGSIKVFNGSNGTADVILDVAGFFS